MYKTRVTKGAAAGHLGWVRRAAAHPQVVAALAEGHILSESVARRICQWTDKLPEDCRLAADAILILAAKSGADLRGLAELAAEIYARSLPDDPDDGPDDGFDDRSVRLETTFDGAGVLAGDLTPECAAVVTAVLDALSAPAGAEDTRTYGQRYHDALQEAMRRLAASDLLPERAGQPVKVWVRISRWPTSCSWRAARRCRRNGSPRPGRPGSPRGPVRRWAGATGRRGWTATPPRRSPATLRSPPWSPAT